MNVEPFLREIADRLWSGHAVVMIGSGFSKNAKQIYKNSKEFPTWPQLGDSFYKIIYGGKPTRDAPYLNVLKLADEVQAALGRPVLDRSLLNSIPDQDYNPSELHTKLLSLPWSDVFTTNYDTLLERTCLHLSSIKYDIVLSKDDLANAERPRIVKLHGSFPSTRPFIVTEEDYRTYPRQFAPFVNTVQQALIENTFCLVGFSGDDPNFLQWIGWIRDNLGKENSHKLFLIGIINLTDAKKKFLEARNIVVLDLANCSGVDGDHYRALNFFCDYMNKRKTKAIFLEWPPKSQVSPASIELDQHYTKTVDITKEWNEVRKKYPGWIILPEEKRKSIAIDTKRWMPAIYHSKKMPIPVDLEFSHELNWRLERCLMPLFRQLADQFEEILSRYCPFPELFQSEDASRVISPITQEYENLDWKHIKEIWLSINLSLLRFYRENGYHDKWTKTNEIMSRLVSLLPQEGQDILCYERVLYHLFCLNLPEVKKHLESWPIDNSIPLWKAKKAGIMAEIGQIREAERILEQSLNEIRARLNAKPVSTDLSWVSQESYVMLVLNYVKHSLAVLEGAYSMVSEFFQQNAPRFTEIKKYICDPWNELKLFEMLLAGDYKKYSFITETKGFDIGATSRTQHWIKTDDDALAAFGYLRFLEEISIPYRLYCIRMNIKSLIGTLPRIASYSPFFALAVMGRIGNTESIDMLFTREFLTKLDQVTIDQLVDEYIKNIEGIKKDLRIARGANNESFADVLAQTIPEILSRLCTRCSDSARDKIFDFALSLYRSVYISCYSCIANLTRRLLASYPPWQYPRLVTKLLVFPFPEGAFAYAIDKYEPPLPILLPMINSTQLPLTMSVDSKQVEGLLCLAASGVPHRRKWGLSSLITIYLLGIFPVAHDTDFADILWAQTDETGFPANTGFSRDTVLNLPHPGNVTPKKLFKKYVDQNGFLVHGGKAVQQYPMTGGNLPICEEICRAYDKGVFDKDEIVKIFQRLVEWWDADKDLLDSEKPGDVENIIRNEFKLRFANLVNVLVYVVAPSFTTQTETKELDSARRILGEISKYSIGTLLVKAAFLHLFSDLKDDLIASITHSLVSLEREVVKDALDAIYILVKSQPDTCSDVHGLLATNLGLFIMWRHQAGLYYALNTASTLIEQSSSLLSQDFEKHVKCGLEQLATETDLQKGNEQIHITEKLELRQQAARLAFAFYKYYKDHSVSIPTEIEMWRTICESPDEFSEIRNQWRSQA